MGAFAEKPARTEPTAVFRAVQRSPRASTGDVEGGSVAAIAFFGGNFSRVPLRADVRGAVQPKPEIDTPEERHEQEADRAAEHVMASAPPPVGSGEAEGQGDRIPLQLTPRKPGARGGVRVTAQSRRPGQPLSGQERSFFESRFGHDFSQVRIHADSRSAEIADALNADAFTVGSDIHFGAGRLQRGTKGSDRLLAHELAHVVQQSGTEPALQAKLTITGKEGDVARAIALLNSGLGSFYYVSIDAGDVKLAPIRAAHTSSEEGPTAQQKALADRLWTIINDPKTVLMTASSGTTTVGGSYATGDFDIADLEVYGVGGFIHEIEEQYQKQAKGKAFGSETEGAHSEAMKAESEVRGATRGVEKTIYHTPNSDGTFDAEVEIPHTFPDGTVKTMVMTIKSNNIVSVIWK